MKKIKLTAESVSQGLGKEVKVEYDKSEKVWFAHIYNIASDGKPLPITGGGLTEDKALRKAVRRYYEIYDKSKIYTRDNLVKTSNKFLPRMFRFAGKLADFAWASFLIVFSTVFFCAILFLIAFIMGFIVVILLGFGLESIPLWFILLCGFSSVIFLPLLISPFFAYSMLKESLDKEADRLTFEEVSVPVGEGSLCLSSDKEGGKLSPS
jgi:hypothetical protein